MQRHHAQHGEGRVIISHACRQLGAQVDRHAHHLGMLAIAGHPIAKFEGGDNSVKLCHHTEVSTAHGQRLVELVAYRADAEFKPVAADSAD